jgi:2-oxoglutarate ferredoxin oxidoreductase subunit gamma
LISGFEGQGIVLADYVLGKAAAVCEGKEASLVQSYGPESRGGACKAEVVIGEEQIDYPRATDPEVMVIMSQEAYHTYAAKRHSDCLLIIDEDLVDPKEEKLGMKMLKIPATRLAEQLGRKIVANMVMLGFVTGVTGIVSKEAMKEAIRTSVPRGTEELNLRAFETGYEYAQKLVSAEVTSL